MIAESLLGGGEGRCDHIYMNQGIDGFGQSRKEESLSIKLARSAFVPQAIPNADTSSPSLMVYPFNFSCKRSPAAKCVPCQTRTDALTGLSPASRIVQLGMV